MARRTLRNLAVATLAAGCFLSSFSAVASAAAAVRLSAAVRAPAVAFAPIVGGPACTHPLPEPNLASGEEPKDLLWPVSKMELGSAGVFYLSRGSGVTVAVIDTGIDTGMVKAGQVLGSDTVLPGASVEDMGGSGDYDCDGHGTAVAALIAGRENGIPGFMGVAPDATILPIRQTSDPAQPGSAVRLADAIRTATAAGARVINISIAVTEDPPELKSAVQEALASDVVIVAAAGTGVAIPGAAISGTAITGAAANGVAAGGARANGSGARKDLKYYPASLPGVLAVGAVDRNGDPSGFEQQTSGVNISAPGGLMAVPAAGYPGRLTAEHGVGFASAFVAGTAALVLSHRPTLHNWQVAQRLEVTADHPAAGGLNGAVGWGVVNPYRAVSTVLADESRPDPSSAPGNVVPAGEAMPGHGRTAGQMTLGVVLVLGVPVLAAALRRGRIRGPRAGA
ncbi:S8 family serine peptidase [Catenulispora yoronensis]|uniref:S8 family serine peptidase n=1 Tax=Catenulispora yoronensis TaxID=450799 RepID=UPI0031E030C6